MMSTNRCKKYIFSTSSFLTLLVTLGTTVAKTENCDLPANLKVPGKTFIIKNDLSCPTNVFMHAVPAIGMEADKKVSDKEKKKNPQAVGRLAYELLGDHFAKNKPNITVKDLKVKGSDGKHEIPVRLYEGTDKDKAILYIHGGGWSRGNLETHDTLCRNLADATKATVLAVDYRLAPENPHPAGLNDAEDAYNYFMAEQGKGKKIYIAGDSGGGNITTSLIIKLIQDGKPAPSGAILIYPALDLSIPEKTSNPYSNGYFLTRDSINAYINNYTGHNPEKAKDPTVSPVMASDDVLKKFPPVIFLNAQCDPLEEEGSAFAERLTKLGVSVNRKVIPNTVHVFAQYPDIFPEAKEAVDFIKDALAKAK